MEPEYTLVVEDCRQKKGLELYQKLLLLRPKDPYDIDNFSQEVNVQDQQLQLYKNELKAQLIAFTVIMNWTARVNQLRLLFHDWRSVILQCDHPVLVLRTIQHVKLDPKNETFYPDTFKANNFNGLLI